MTTNTQLTTTAVIMLALLTLCALCGCDQREIKNYEHTIKTEIRPDLTIVLTETHNEWNYKTNRLATWVQVDSVFLDIPGKVKLLFGPQILDNDSFDLMTPYGTLGTTEGE